MRAKMLLQTFFLVLLIPIAIFCVVAGGLWYLVIALFSLVSACASVSACSNSRPLLSPVLGIGAGAITGAIISPPPQPIGTIIGLVFGMWGWAWITFGWLPIRRDRLPEPISMRETANIPGGRLLLISLEIFITGPLLSMLLFIIGSHLFGIRQLDWFFYFDKFVIIGTFVGTIVAVPYFALGLIRYLQDRTTGIARSPTIVREGEVGKAGPSRNEMAVGLPTLNNAGQNNQCHSPPVNGGQGK